MSDLKALFDEVTRDTRPDRDVWRQQEDRQRRAVRNRKLGAVVAAAAVVAAVGVFAVRSVPEGNEGSLGSRGELPSRVPPQMPGRGEQDLAFVALDGTPLAAIPSLPQDAAQVDLSPDGRTIVFAATIDGGTRIATMPVEGGDPTILTPEGIPGYYRPAWSPDGRRIVYEKLRLSGQIDLGIDLYVMDADGSNPRQLTRGVFDDVWAAWSPDGRTVVYVSLDPTENPDAQFATSGEIWTIPAEGGTPTQLTDDAVPDAYPDYSPDGSRIVYLHDDALWVMDADGTHRERLLDEPVFTPRWSPDGTKIAFGVYDDSFEPVITFGDGTDSRPIVTVTVLDLTTDVVEPVGEVAMVYDVNAPIWWSDDVLLVHRVGHSPELDTAPSGG